MKLIFLGPPGAGKGTISAGISKDFNLPHISTGDIFRSNIKNETEIGKQVKAIISAGDLVPDELTTAMVKDRIAEDDAKEGFILDGFPRTIPQAEAFDKFCKADRVINFQLSDEAIIERLSGRRMCKSCGSIFHIKFMPTKKEGICDNCSSELYIRDDDKIEAIKNRLEVYRKQTEPLIEHYSKQDLITDIDSSPAPKEVLGNLVNFLKTL